MSRIFAVVATFIFGFSQFFLIALPSRVMAEVLSEDALRSQIEQQTSLNTSLINTGDNTDQSSQSDNDTSTQVSSQNNAAIDQNVNATANTGHNEASRNISIGGNAGMITTGDATVTATGLVDANNTTSIVGSNNSTPQNAKQLFNTGDGSSSVNSSDSQSYTFVNNGNTAYINQAVKADTNTGHNIADRNISIGGSAGQITTGKASTNTNFLVAANGAVTVVGGENSGNGPGSGASIILANTGTYGQSNTSLNQTDTTELNNVNTVTLSQSCITCSAITGHNSSNRGIGIGGDAGVIQTADAAVNVVFFADANTNTTRLYRLPDGTVLNGNIFNTGDGVFFNQNVSSSQHTTSNSLNVADTTQTINALADTGHNTANRNISIGGNAGIITTGNATVNALMIAELNKNNKHINQSSAMLMSGY